MCNCGARPHQVLRGRSKIMGSAGQLLLSRILGVFLSSLLRLVCFNCEWLGARKLDIAGCCKSASIRIGEASHHVLRGLPSCWIGRCSTQDPATELLEARLLEGFKGWCKQCVESIDIHMFDLVPGLSAEGLWVYLLQSWFSSWQLPSLGDCCAELEAGRQDYHCPLLAACSKMGAQ